MGVRRAVDLALEHASPAGSHVYTLGKLIHNRSAVELLRNRGAEELDPDNPPPVGTKVLVRAHGVPPELQAQYEARGHVIVDGTCPKVKTVHKVISRYRGEGYQVVIAGDKGHAEVVGLQGYAGSAGHLVQTPDDIERLPPMDKVCLVSQTTYDKEMFRAIARRLRERFSGSEVVVKTTICSATEQRQDEVRRLAREADAIVVVGGRDSANTVRLASIARECGALTQHVETEADIDWPALERCRTVAVTAGASTPHWMIRRVVDHLQALAQQQSHTARGFAEQLFDAVTYLNFIVAVGAGAMYYVSCALQGIAYRLSGSLLAFLYFLSMYLWNSLANLERTQHLGLQRYRFYRGHRALLFALAGLCIASLLAFSFFESRLLFYLMLFATAAGSAYHVTIVPRFLRRIVPYSNLRDVPTSRDLFVALAWGILLTLIPHVLGGRIELTAHTALTFIWVFSLAYLRSLIFDLRDIEGDRIMGRETLVSIIGERRARSGVLIAMRLLLVVVVAYAAIDIFGTRGLSSSGTALLFQLPVLLYLYLFERHNRTHGIRRASVFTALMDLLFVCAGILAVLGSLVTPP